MRESLRPRRTDLARSIARSVEALHWASERIGHQFSQRHSLHATDLRALTAVYRAELTGRPLTASVLAEELHLSPATISYAVGRLVASGHLRREQDPEDGRRVLLRYSQAGLDIAGDFFGPLALAQAEVLSAFTDQELDVADRVMGSLVWALESYDDQLRAELDHFRERPGE